MKYEKIVALIGISTALCGCAGLDFGNEGLSFYEPKPYLFVSVNKDCIFTATLISLPGAERHVKFRSGYGSSDISIALSNGILTNVGQKIDTKIPETMTSIASLGGTVMKSLTENGGNEVICNPSAILYPIVNGIPDTDNKSRILLFPVDSR